MNSEAEHLHNMIRELKVAKFDEQERKPCEKSTFLDIFSDPKQAC